jgi:hypothetical protein
MALNDLNSGRPIDAMSEGLGTSVLIAHHLRTRLVGTQIHDTAVSPLNDHGVPIQAK